MSDVFVSYKAEDRKRVKPLVAALEAEGYSVWWDEQIGGGAAWRHTIEAELNAARCVVVVWSKRSVGPDGAFVQDEATCGLRCVSTKDRKRKMASARIGTCRSASGRPRRCR